MGNPVYVYLYPQDMEADNSKNYHVIEAEQDSDTGALSFPYGRKCLDGQFKKKSRADIKDFQIHEYDDVHMREFLAESQNSGNEVCANCARHFYADDGQP